MEIKTNQSREVESAGIIPPPDKSQRRKKGTQKPANSPVAGRRFILALKSLGRFCAFLLTVSFLLSIFVYAFTSDKFNLREIKFTGCKELDPQKLEAIIRQNFPPNLLKIDLRQLKKLLEGEAWVKQVAIRRVLPSELIIYIEERIPAVILEMQGELLVADEDGILLNCYESRFGKLDKPVFRGVMGENMKDYRLYQEGNSARIRKALAMLKEIENGSPEDAKKISEVDISDRENLKILLVDDTVDDTVEVYLGDKDYLKRFRTLMDNMGIYRELKEQKNDIASIDLRLENKILYQPRSANPSIQR
jgi:cell division septal protein FtsQ